MSETPETDAAQHEGLLRTNPIPMQVVTVNFARKLERERDEAMALSGERYGYWQDAVQEYEDMRSKWRQVTKERDEAMEKIRRLEKQIEGSKNFANERFEEIQRVRRERDEARHEIEGWRNKWDCAVTMGAKAEIERDEAQASLTDIHRWIERNHPDGFIDSLTFHQNLERVGDRWYDRLDQVKRERNDFLDRLNEILKPIPIK